MSIQLDVYRRETYKRLVMDLEILTEDKELKGPVKATFRIDPDMFWTLKELAVHKRTNTTELLHEAIRDILAKYGYTKGKATAKK